ncbi:hypothetical protein [Ancylomarina longa]|uniref:Uncharacterized protein n=1 Tax=Ancylomarina longa TaxID=2487017 RepID=A0A434ATI4_9BACT|nr:hypothetical protein [Ancylomarina longa]RUT77727.1 hypothetical protein DLK05_11710 [Ancylomarina longa]
MGDSLAFSALNREKFLQRAANTDFDFVFTTCGFKEAAFCLLASNQGLKCALFYGEDFSCKLHPVVDAKSASQKLVLAFRKQFPHLILPDEYLNVNPKVSVLKSMLPGKIQHKDIFKYESKLQGREGDCVFLDREYKLNANRLLMSMIKTAVRNGVIVLNHISTERRGSSNLLISDKLSVDSKQIELHSKQILKLEEPNESLKANELHFLLNRKQLFLKRSLKFQVQNQLVRFIRYQDYFLGISKIGKNEKDTIKEVINQLNDLLVGDDKFEEADVFVSHILQPSEWQFLDRALLSLQAMAKEYLQFSSGQFIEAIAKINAIDTNFEGSIEIQQLIEYGDFRFDEAKQTGVHPIAFKNIFYRFGSEIDQLTEAAYEGRSKFDSGNKLWEHVQFWYLLQTEMICHKQDYYNRIGKKRMFSKYELIADEQFLDDYFSNV